MKLVKQSDYTNIEYKTYTTDGLVKINTVAQIGCGLCCGLMVANHFGYQRTINEMLTLAYRAKANQNASTNYKLFSRALATELKLYCRRSDDIKEIFDCLDLGGAVIVNSGGSYIGHNGLLSDIGHYLYIESHKGMIANIYDPCFSKEKYEKTYRKEKITIKGEMICCDIYDVIEDTLNREAPFYLFNKYDDKEKDENYLNLLLKYTDDHFVIEQAARQLWDIEINDSSFIISDQKENVHILTFMMNKNNKETFVSLYLALKKLKKKGRLPSFKLIMSTDYDSLIISKNKEKYCLDCNAANIQEIADLIENIAL